MSENLKVENIAKAQSCCLKSYPTTNGGRETKIHLQKNK
jgi:hypothetical protein